MSTCQGGTRAIGFVLVGAVALYSAGAMTANARSAAPGAQQQPAAGSVDGAKSSQPGRGGPGSTMMGQDMMAMRQKMMADDKAADARLQPLLDKMNAAKGEAKVEAMAAVVNELIRQRTTMHAQMGQMSQMMMNQMMTNQMMMNQVMMNQMMPKKGAGDTPTKP